LIGAADAHEIAFEWPWGGETVIHLPTFAPLHLGGLTIDVSPTKHVVFMLFAATLVWLTMFVAGRVLTRQRAEGRPPRGLASMVEAMVLFVRNDVAVANIGHGGEKFAPYIMTLFFFILYMNLLGLMPWGATATGRTTATGPRMPSMLKMLDPITLARAISWRRRVSTLPRGLRDGASRRGSGSSSTSSSPSLPYSWKGSR